MFIGGKDISLKQKPALWVRMLWCVTINEDLLALKYRQAAPNQTSRVSSPGEPEGFCIPRVWASLGMETTSPAAFPCPCAVRSWLPEVHLLPVFLPCAPTVAAPHPPVPHPHTCSASPTVTTPPPSDLFLGSRFQYTSLHRLPTRLKGAALRGEPVTSALLARRRTGQH